MGADLVDYRELRKFMDEYDKRLDERLDRKFRSLEQKTDNLSSDVQELKVEVSNLQAEVRRNGNGSKGDCGNSKKPGPIANLAANLDERTVKMILQMVMILVYGLLALAGVSIALNKFLGA